MKESLRNLKMLVLLTHMLLLKECSHRLLLLQPMQLEQH